MKTVKFKKWLLKPIESDYVGLDDIICVNGLVGWLDFYCPNYIVVVTENEVSYKIPIKKIRSLRKLSTFIEGNMTNVPISELLCA